MKKIFTLSLLLTILVIILGCSSTTNSLISFSEEKYKNDDDAIIYIYRLKSMVGAATGWNVYVDELQVGVLKQNAYMVLHVAPGKHSIKIGDSGPILDDAIANAIAQNPEAFIFKGKESYYIRSQGFTVRLITKDMAMPELKEMKFDMGL